MSRDRVELKKTKKEHYVPKCYLKRWENTNGRVYVYDKKNNTHWISGIDDIACERFFYDIKHTGLNNDNLMFLHEHGVYPEKDDQFIEHFFASQIEPEYSKTLENILDKEKSPWYKDNCFFIGKEKRFILSICLVYQYVRTKSVRGLMIDFSNCIGKLLNDLGCDEETRNMHILKPGMEKVVQGNMILDINHVLELAEAFCRLTWVLGVNKSGIPLYTSDNPLGTVGHIKHPFLSTAGICNRGARDRQRRQLPQSFARALCVPSAPAPAQVIGRSARRSGRLHPGTAAKRVFRRQFSARRRYFSSARIASNCSSIDSTSLIWLRARSRLCPLRRILK